MLLPRTVRFGARAWRVRLLRTRDAALFRTGTLLHCTSRLLAVIHDLGLPGTKVEPHGTRPSNHAHAILRGPERCAPMSPRCVRAAQSGATWPPTPTSCPSYHALLLRKNRSTTGVEAARTTISTMQP